MERLEWDEKEQVKDGMEMSERIGKARHEMEKERRTARLGLNAGPKLPI